MFHKEELTMDPNANFVTVEDENIPPYVYVYVSYSLIILRHPKGWE